MATYRSVEEYELIKSVMQAARFLRKQNIGPETAGALHDWTQGPLQSFLRQEQTTDKPFKTQKDRKKFENKALAGRLNGAGITSFLMKFNRLLRYYALLDVCYQEEKSEACKVYKALQAWGALGEHCPINIYTALDAEIDTHLLLKLLDSIAMDEVCQEEEAAARFNDIWRDITRQDKTMYHKLPRLVGGLKSAFDNKGAKAATNQFATYEPEDRSFIIIALMHVAYLTDRMDKLPESPLQRYGIPIPHFAFKVKRDLAALTGIQDHIDKIIARHCEMYPDEGSPSNLGPITKVETGPKGIYFHATEKLAMKVFEGLTSYQLIDSHGHPVAVRKNNRDRDPNAPSP